MTQPPARRTAPALGAAAAGGALLLAPAPAHAHGIAGRADLPIPAELFAAAAAAVLVVSFLALAVLWSRPRLERPPERAILPLGRGADVLLGLLGVLAFAVSVAAGLFGPGAIQDNLAPTMVYVVFWVGVPLASLLLGDVFRLLSPWRAIGRLVGFVGARVPGGLPEPLPYPERLGRWPAVATILAFAICELAWAQGREPDTLAVLLLAYLVVQLVGMSLYGVEPWTRNADGFGVLFSLVARLAPLARRDGMLVLRPPAASAAGMRLVPGTVALLIVAIGSTAFDGAREGPLFNDALPEVQAALMDVGLARPTALEAGYLLGLLLTVGAVALLWRLAVEGLPRVRGGASRRGLSGRFAHPLIPIAAAYVLAHYFSLLAYQGQDVYRLASDPLGSGADLLGGAGAGIDYGVVSATGIWYVQVGALVVGHVAALILAHDRALTVYGGARAATRSQLAMLVTMVCFTFLGLWLLSVANS